MSSEFPDYPDTEVIPNTDYSLILVYADEFRMAVHTGKLKATDSYNNTHIDLTSWSAHAGIRAKDFIHQSAENPNIIFISILVPEYYKKKEIKGHVLHSVKFNLAERTFKVCEKAEKVNDISKKFYPVDELPSIKKLLETHIHSRKARDESKFK